MIKKIVDWTAGSFFRTIGRLLVFVIIGFLVAKLVDFSSIKWTDLLGIETIDALTYTTEVKTISSSYFDINNASDFTCATWDTCQFEITSSDTNPIGSKTIQINSSYNTTDKDFIGFYIMVSQPVEIVGTANGVMPVCTQWTQSGNTYYCSNSTGQTNINGIIQQSNLEDINFQFKAEYTDNNNAYCDLDGNEIICPTFKKQIARLVINWNIKTHFNSYVLFRFNKIANNMYYSSPTSAIESQTQQQQQQHNETMSYFQDSNTTSTEEEASSFFEDFSVTDHGGLSSILTAPLTIVSKVLDDTCTPATFTYRNKQVVLPCGQYFWNQAPELRDWLSTIESGIIAYAILVALFKMIQKLESPSNSEVEVESL